MSRICQLSGKKPMVGNNVSHSNKKTKRRFDINLIKKRFYIPSKGEWITLKVTTSTLKTIDKKGISEVIKIAKKKGLL
ncbi:MAG: 50S ribosomal protein L28 [Flavobacteriales bacterium]|nr:50S ribosomal protein L28 [Flavobacteriales bacterium]|tara:strand:+ start:9154 stop:9387 length:234 start_codon:yes stop_codon:yes gene_type:complete